MSRNSCATAIAAAALLSIPPCGLAADESALVLADAPARVKVQSSCSICHSVDYILMNSPFQDRAGWDKTVTKMIKVMGAPISAEDAAEIGAYLDAYYGKPPAR
jgi:sulfite dehydrogenase (cytochrome) subunit B